MLGRVKVNVPVKVCNSAAPWSTPSPTIERMTHRSSAHSRMFGNRSLMGRPLWPALLNFQGDFIKPPVLPAAKVSGCLMGSGLPSLASRYGLGSKVSIEEGPPCMKRKITRLARAGNMGGLGISGSAEDSANAASAKRDCSPMYPKPQPAARSMARRESSEFLGALAMSDRISILPLLVDKHEFVGSHQRVGKTGPRLLFIDVIPFLAKTLHVRKSRVDLVCVRPAAEHAQVDFFDAPLADLFLLQHCIRQGLCFAYHQRAIHHEQCLCRHSSRTASAVRRRGIAEIEQGVESRQIGAAQRQVDTAAIRAFRIHADAVRTGLAIGADSGVERAAHRQIQIAAQREIGIANFFNAQPLPGVVGEQPIFRIL